MDKSRPPLTTEPAWQALERHFGEIESKHLRALFAEDPKRAERFTLEAAGVRLDYSKHRVTRETLALLVKLAEACRLRQHIDAMFAGERINATEGRPVLHVALRAPKGADIRVDGK